MRARGSFHGASWLGVLLALAMVAPQRSTADTVAADVATLNGPVGCRPTALVVALHPWGSSGPAYGRTVHTALGDACVRLWSPSGPLEEGRGRAWLRTMALSPEQRRLAREAREQADQTATRLARLVRAGEALVVTGHSQGAIVAWTLAARHPELAATYVLTAGMLPAVDPLPGGGRVIALHGRADEYVPLRSAQAGADRLRGAGRDVTFAIEDAGHGLRGRLRDAWWRQLRHAVSGS